MTERVLILAAVTVLIAVVIRMFERRPIRRKASLPAGLTLVSGSGCGLCLSVRNTLDHRGTPYREVDISEVPDLGIRSLPTLLLVDDSGEITWKRSGRSAVVDAARLQEIAV